MALIESQGGTGLVHIFSATEGILPSSFADVRASTASAYDGTGKLLSYPSNTARIDYSPSTRQVSGLFVEAADTNSIIQSGALTNAAWTVLNATSATSTTAPDGSGTFTTVTANAGTDINVGVRPTTALTVTSGTTYTVSCFVQLGTASQGVYLQVTESSNSLGEYVTALFDLYTSPTSDGTASSTYTGSGGGTLVSTKKEYLGTYNGVGTFRISLTFSINNTSIYPKIGFYDPAAIVVQTANGNPFTVYSGGQTARFWGAQFETDSVTSSYIPTSATSVTRAAGVTPSPCRVVLQAFSLHSMMDQHRQ